MITVSPNTFPNASLYLESNLTKFCAKPIAPGFFEINIAAALGLYECILFNGKNLDGWNIHGTELWYVENGILICESGPDKGYGYLSTEKFYDDFDLTVEFKQDANGNSGVFIRSTFEGTKVSGWQVEVAPPGSHTGGVYESYGRGWLIKPDKEKDKLLKMGKWNKMRIRVVGNQIQSWLNGTSMISLEDEMIGKGKGSIALQIHDCLLYTSPSPRDKRQSRMPSSA